MPVERGLQRALEGSAVFAELAVVDDLGGDAFGLGNQEPAGFRTV